MNLGARRPALLARRAADLLAVGLALAAAYQLRFASGLVESGSGLEPLAEHLLRPLPFALALAAAALEAAGVYRRPPRGAAEEVRIVLRGSVYVVVLTVAATFFDRAQSYSRLMAVAFAGGTPLCLLCGRAVLRAAERALRRRGVGLRRALVVGGGEPARLLCEHLRYEGLGVELVGWIPTGSAGEEPDPGAAVLGTLDEVPNVVAAYGVEDVYLAVPQEAPLRLRELDRALSRTPVDVHFAPDLAGCALIRPEVFRLGDLPLITLRQGPHTGLDAWVKRGFDLLGAAALLLVFSPLLALIAAAIKLSSPGPVLFRQLRVGWGGRRFTILKFRTMCVDAERIGPTRTLRDDPRRTRVGAFLRRTSLDELPQLLNVLRGDMSLVGPRPEPLGHYPALERELPEFMLRHSVRAGMTGWAQVHGLRGDAPVKERLRFDLDYIRRWSLLLDLKILALTAVRGFVHPNAF
ncbi:MAG: undecaprenyl-phosphate glucose phosphotransferase [Planctomycetota bacterium]|nr:MAG: undecaprenyl-phosphate glucose phosphotransferase [Planctomycetota bacterium]